MAYRRQTSLQIRDALKHEESQSFWPSALALLSHMFIEGLRLHAASPSGADVWWNASSRSVDDCGISYKLFRVCAPWGRQRQCLSGETQESMKQDDIESDPLPKVLCQWGLDLPAHRSNPLMSCPSYSWVPRLCYFTWYLHALSEKFYASREAHQLLAGVFPLLRVIWCLQQRALRDEFYVFHWVS